MAPRTLNTAALAKLRPCWFPCAFPDNRVRLASQIHSLVRFSKRTTRHRLLVIPTAASQLCRFSRDLLCLVAPSPPDFRPYCTSLLRMLFSVRSRYLFTIGLGEYLALTVDACRIHEGFPTPATPELTHTILTINTGLSPCFAPHSRGLLDEFPALIASPYTTLPVRASVWATSFSLAVTHDIALRVLFLPLLRCFSSGSSPLREAIAVGIPIRKSRVLPLLAGPSSLSQLGTSFVGFRAEPFTRRHSSHCCDSVKRVQWTPGSHVHTVSFARPVVRVRASTLPIRVCTGWCIGPPYLDSKPVTHLRDTVSNRYGIWTHWDLNPGPPPCKGGALPLSYGPVRRTVLALVVHRCPAG